MSYLCANAARALFRSVRIDPQSAADIVGPSASSALRCLSGVTMPAYGGLISGSAS